MKLALRLGRTLGELQQSMSVSELRLWVEFDKINPIGDERSDYHAAQITAATYNAQGGKVDLADALIKWSEQEEEDEWADIEARFKQLAR
ncbi:phage tail assembly protein T [Serratia aquatilis]|uniref:DUF4035 domain-containing protein n=1 Tax=Serratia aquatilis TaxID=1737515 RepID=A0ABV6EGS6_9GAMM